MEPLYFLGQDKQNEVQHDFFGHVTPLALAMTLHGADGIIIIPSHSLGPDVQNEVQHDFLVKGCYWNWHWCHSATSVINGSIALLASMQSDSDAT